MLSTPEAIRISLRILRVQRRLLGGASSRGWGVSMTETDILRVIEAFEASGAQWALVGAHAVGFMTEPRATVDFDFIVEGRKLKSVLRRLEQDFGDLGAEDIGAAVRLAAIDVDLIRSDNHALFREALERAERTGDWNIPPPEVIILLKFLSASSPWSNRDKRIAVPNRTSKRCSTESIAATRSKCNRAVRSPQGHRERRIMDIMSTSAGRRPQDAN
jgi:hypothetical protein